MSQLPDVGSTIALSWPDPNFTAPLELKATVRNVETSHKMKHGSKHIFTLDCDDGKTRKTRLLNLQWKLDGDMRHGKGKKRKNDVEDEGREIDSSSRREEESDKKKGSHSSSGKGGSGNEKASKKKLRWTEGRNGSQETKDKTIYVKQIPYAATFDDVKRHFKAARVRILKDAEGKSRGQAFIEFSCSGDATAALGLNGSLLQGRPLTVEKMLERDDARQRDQKRLEAKANEKNKIGSGGGSNTNSHQDPADASTSQQGAAKLDMDLVNNLIASCVRRCSGAVKRADFDSRAVEFMRALSAETLKAALFELSSTPIVKDRKVANMPSFLMGILKRVAAGAPRPTTEQAKRSREEREGKQETQPDEEKDAGKRCKTDGKESDQNQEEEQAKRPKNSPSFTNPSGKPRIVVTASAEVEANIRAAVLASGGKLVRSDFDAKHMHFLQDVPEKVGSAALAEFAAHHKLDEIRNKGSYFMGVLRRHAAGEDAPPGTKGKGKGKGKGGGRGGKGAESGKGKGKGKGGGRGGKGAESGKGKGKGGGMGKGGKGRERR